MRPVALIRGVWNSLIRRRRTDDALDREVRSYVELLATEHERGGLSPEAARRRALIETGGVEQVKEATRDAWLGATLSTTARELRFTLRGLRNAPAFTIISILILGMGIGGATAIFTVIKGSLLQPLPGVHEPSRLVSLEPTRGNALLYDFSYPDYRELREHTRSLSGLAGYDGTSMVLEDAAGPQRSTWVSYVTGNFFQVLGAPALIGRTIEPSDEDTSAPVVVLAYDLWHDRYRADPHIVGTTVHLARHVVTVIGVAQPGFVGAMLMHPMEAWIPATTLPSLVGAPGVRQTVAMSNADTFLRLVGRLAPRRTLANAQSEFSRLAIGLADASRADKGLGIKVFSGAGMTADERARLAKLPRLLAVAVGLLLLIACANVANLSLIRAAARGRELATRLSLGASRHSLVGRCLMEGGVIAVGGGVIGVGLAQILVRAHSVASTIADMPTRVGLDVSLDGRVLAVAIAAVLLTMSIVSLAPMLQVLRVPPNAVLKDGAAGAVRRRSSWQRLLVGAQIAASLVLLASAAVVFNAFQRALGTDPGFQPAGLTVAGADLWQARLDSAGIIEYERRWMDEAAHEPSIAAAAMASQVPPAAWARMRWIFRGADAPARGTPLGDAPAGGMQSFVDVVSPEFFGVMHIPITLGRGLVSSDDQASERVVVVSRRLAAMVWPGANPIGQMLSVQTGSGSRTTGRVIGVSGDVRFSSIIDEVPPVAYVAVAQHPGESLSFVIRSRNGGAIPDPVLDRLAARVDPRVPVYTSRVNSRIGEEVRPQRIASAWIAVFGATALLLAAIGLYGVVAQGVLQRTRELAVRSALGATPRGLVSLVIGDGMRIAVLGAVVGMAVGAGALRVLESQFDGVGLGDSSAGAVALAILSIAMLGACYLPARRAARLNPSDALRSD